MNVFWAKIVVERWFYRWKNNLAVESKSRWNLTVELWFYHWNLEISSQLSDQTQIQSRALDGWPLEASVIWAIKSMRVWYGLSNHAGEMGDLLPKNRRYFDDFPLSQPTYWKNRRFIAFCKNITIFANFPPSDKSPQNIMSPISNTQYIGDILSIYPDIFFRVLSFHLSRSICI